MNEPEMHRCYICHKFRKLEDLRLIPPYDEKEPGLETLTCCRNCAPPEFVFVDSPPELWEL